MKSGLDIAFDVYSLINIPEITSQITGKVYTGWRPNNSDKIDIVVALLNANNEQIQIADVNIRIHAPNEGSGIPVPPLKTLHRITNLILPFVDTQYKSSFSTEVDIPGEIMTNTDGSYFSLIRLVYRSYNSEYNNI